MDFTPLEKDMNIISALDDEPNDVGGLTATELKAKFDEGGNAIKDLSEQHRDSGSESCSWRQGG